MLPRGEWPVGAYRHVDAYRHFEGAAPGPPPPCTVRTRDTTTHVAHLSSFSSKPGASRAKAKRAARLDARAAVCATTCPSPVVVSFCEGPLKDPGPEHQGAQGQRACPPCGKEDQQRAARALARTRGHLGALKHLKLAVCEKVGCCAVPGGHCGDKAEVRALV